MFFKTFVAAETSKVGLIIIATAFALMRADCSVLVVTMFAFTRGTPLCNIEPLSTWEPPLTNFFWSRGDEAESSAFASCTAGLLFAFC